MTVVLGTLPFVATLWLLMVLGAAVLEESGAKIAAALKGKSGEPQPIFARSRIRPRGRVQQPMRAPARWRAAA